MKKEDVLQASRNENQNKDLYELEVARKGQRIGGLIGLSIAFALMCVERVIFEDGTNYGYFCIILSAALGLFTYKAIKLKRKQDIIMSVLYFVMTAYAVVMQILNYLGQSHG